MSDGPHHEPTRRLPGAGVAAEPTQRLEPPVSASRPGEPAPAQEERGRAGRDAVAGLIGAIVGIVLALLVVALGTRGPDDTAELAAAQQQIEGLEAELADRDATLAELEARLAEAEAAAGQRDEDIDAQRRALEDRAAALDDRAAGIDQREAAVEARERELAQREAAQQGTDEPPADGDDGGSGIGLPDVDLEQAETAVERFLERIRELFRGADG